eukprot:gene20879-13416_t
MSDGDQRAHRCNVCRYQYRLTDPPPLWRYAGARAAFAFCFLLLWALAFTVSTAVLFTVYAVAAQCVSEAGPKVGDAVVGFAPNLRFANQGFAKGARAALVLFGAYRRVTEYRAQ